MRRYLILPLILVLTILNACKKSVPPPAIAEKTQILSLPQGSSSVVGATNSFAFDMLKATLLNDTAATNKLISPLSIYLALSMAYNGAGQATQDSMAAALQIAGLDINTLDATCKALISQLPAEDNKVQLSIANSLWYRQNSYQPLSSFLSTTQNDFDATVKSLDFSAPGAVSTINQWVAQNTGNLIPSIINQISSNDLMYLIDAIYFKGNWQHAFDPASTESNVFSLRDGSTKMVPFMKQQVKLRYYGNGLYNMIELPYGGGNSFDMYIAVPTNAGMMPESFFQLLNVSWLDTAIAHMDSSELQIEIPKWQYAYSLENMQPELTQLGMGIAFTDQASFPGIYDPSQVQVHISKAIHKTYIQVDETGSQAAAATGIGIGISVVAPPPATFRANQPFFYAIVERQTGVVLFCGVVNDPSAN